VNRLLEKQQGKGEMALGSHRKNNLKPMKRKERGE